jgi:hypothetical protein
VSTGRVLSASQAAARLGLTPGRVQKALRERRLCGFRDPAGWRVLTDEDECFLYRGDRRSAEWRRHDVRYVGVSSEPWPSEVESRLRELTGETTPLGSAATPREREMAAIIEQLQRDREFDRIAARTRADEAAAEISRLTSHLDRERRRRELGVRSALLGLVAMIPAPDEDELRNLDLPSA